MGVSRMIMLWLFLLSHDVGDVLLSGRFWLLWWLVSIYTQGNGAGIEEMQAPGFYEVWTFLKYGTLLETFTNRSRTANVSLWLLPPLPFIFYFTKAV